MHVSRPDRRDRLLLISALAIAMLSLLGAAGERIGYDRWLKANTVKRRTHSLFRQGLMLYHHLPNWVRLFFVGGPRGFCQRHGKSYLTRRRCGGEGGGGGLLTGRAIPSAYRWAWCRWYSRVVEVPVRIEVAAGFVAPGASEPPRLQPSSPPGGSGPAHG